MLKNLFIKKREAKPSFKMRLHRSIDNAMEEMAIFRENSFKRFGKWILVFFLVAVFSLFVFNSNEHLRLYEFPLILSLLIPRMTTLFLFTCPVVALKKPKAAFVFMASMWFAWYGIAYDMVHIGVAVAIMMVLVSALIFFAEREKDYSKYKSLFFRLEAYFLYSVVMVFALQMAQMKNIKNAISLFLLNPDILACNLLCFAAFGSFVFWVRRPKAAISFYTVLWATLAVISFCKSKKTYEPVFFLDIFSVSEGVRAFFNFFSPFFIVLICILILLAIALIVFLFIKEKKSRFSWIKLFSSFLFVMIVISSMYFVGMLNFMAAESKTGKSEYDSKGFVYSFLFYSLDSFVVEPDGYSPTLIESIHTNVNIAYMDEDDTSNVQNVIAIQLESFCDPYEYPGLMLEKDPIPFMRSLMDEYTSGYVKVPVFGGQTVKSEFEFITGLSIQNVPLGYSPYVQYIKDNPIDSLVRYFGNAGFETTAIHNYEGEFFSRHDVYKNLGFDYYIPFECMPEIKKRPGKIWGNDEVFVKYIEEALNNNGDEKNFIYGITVQLHGDYNPISKDEYPMEIYGVEDKDVEGSIAYYIQQMQEVDKVVQDLIEMLSQRDESTYVIFYGDHLPSLFVNAGNELSSEQKYTTPYFTWNNMGITKNEETHANKGDYTADINLYELSTLMMNELNIDGSFMNKFHNVYKGSKTFAQEFSCIQYYKLYDENQSVKFVNDDYQIGMLPFLIENISYEEETGDYIITGQGFTKDTYFCVDSKTVHKLEFIDGTKVILHNFDDELEYDTLISMRIIGSKVGDVLKETEQYKWGDVYAISN